MTNILSDRYRQIRLDSEQICRHLSIEDYGLQAIAQTSPLKWHLAHVSWFFETFCLLPYAKNYRAFDPHYSVMFNSYYNGIGSQFPRAQRHLLSRPTVDDMYGYRHHIDQAMHGLISNNNAAELEQRIILGLHHEQQHQELMLTDLKYNLSLNPLQPAWKESSLSEDDHHTPLKYVSFHDTETWIGHTGNAFAFDNELPRHRAALIPYQLANRLITNNDYMNFIHDGGYDNPALWLSDGWAYIQQHQWKHPLYWRKTDNAYSEFTLHGLQNLAPHRPVTHISFYEADAFARWSDARLPTEAEWEHATANINVSGQFSDHCEQHPAAASKNESALQQLFGTCWEWTNSAYLAYPGFKPAAGAIGEYNGKFMCNQMVLRGGSCATPAEHIRPSYRNFFYPQDRWQFTGIRLARDIEQKQG